MGDILNTPETAVIFHVVTAKIGKAAFGALMTVFYLPVLTTEKEKTDLYIEK